MDNDTGKPDVSQIEPNSRGVYQGDGWKYNKNSDALMLNSGQYDFNYTSPRYRTGDHLNCVNVNHIDVQPSATIVGGMFNGQSLSNYGTVENSLLSTNDIESGGTMTNCLFKRLTPPVGVANCHKLTEVNNSEFEATLLNAPSGFTGCETYYFTGTPTLKVKLSSNEKITCINGEKNYGNKTGPDAYGYYTFTPKAGEDVVLSSNETTAPALEMNYNGWPKTDNMTPINNVYYGDGWTYDGTTLTLKSGEYDFNYTKPKDTASSRYGDSVKCNIVVEENAEITGGILAGNSLTNSGTVKDILFMGYWLTNNNGTLSCLLGSSVYDNPSSFTRHTVKAVDGSEIYYTVNQQSTGNGKQLYFTGTPKFTVKLKNSAIRCINGRTDYGGLKPSDVHGYYTFTPEKEEDIVLNREPYATDLVITEGGIPDTTGRKPIYQDDNSSNPIIGYKGNGWTYMLNGGANGKGVLALMQRSDSTANYIFSDSSWNHSTAIECDVIVEGPAQIHNGVFHGAVTLNASAVASESIFTGTVTLEGISNQISWSYFGEDARLVGFENGTIWHCVFACDTSGYTFSTDPKYCLFASKPADLTTDELRTEDDKEFSATLYSNFLQGKCPEKLTGQKMYVQKDANLIVRRTDGLEIIDGTACTEADWSGWYYKRPYSSDIILKRKYTLTVENGTLKGTTTAQGDFGSGTHITVQANAPTDTDTFFAGWTVTPADTKLMNGTADVDLTQSNITFDMPIAPDDLTLTATYAPNLVIRNGYPTASNGGKTACKGEGWEYILGDPEHGDFLFLSNAQIDFSKISDGSPVECKLFIGYGVAVQGGTFNGDVINNGGILGGTFNGAVENHGTIENGVFNGAVTNIAPGTVSDSITGTGTLNGKPITPNAYTLTVTGGGLVNGKTSAVVKADEEVRLTVGEGQDSMSFNYWDLPTALTKALTAEDSTFSNKVENLTFTMPDLSKYTEDTRFTIRLDIRPAELPDDDDGPSVLGTMATVAVGGAAAGILVWQGVSLGVDSYLQLSLPGGVPVPANRIELVKLLWETAGKPDVVLPALYGDVSTEDAELQKATRWAIDNGLVKPADETDASRFDPNRSVSKYEVARAWFKVKQMLK